MSSEKTLSADKKKGRWSSVLCPCNCATILLLILVGALAIVAWRRHDGALAAGMHSSWGFLLRFGPLFLAGILAAGLLSALVPSKAPLPNSTIPKSTWISTAIFLGLIAVCMVIAWQRRDGTFTKGLQETGQMVSQVWILLVVAWVFAGYISVLLPEGFVEDWLGRESGLRGIVMASVAGGLTPGGPFVSLPIVTGLIRAGAGEGVIVAYLTGWSLYALGRIPFEISFMSPRLTIIRFVSVIIFPPIAGLIAKFFFER